MRFGRRQALAPGILQQGGRHTGYLPMAEEGPDIGLDYEAPDLLCRRFEVVLGVIEKIVEQFSACDRPLATSVELE